MSSPDLDRAARLLEHSLTDDDRLRHPAYAALAERLSHSPTAIAQLASVPEQHRNPVLILAALHYGALRGHPELSRLFAPLGLRPVDPATFAARVVDVLEGEPGVVGEQLHRTVQTNEVGRSAILRAVLHELRRRGLGQVNVVDVGASAGLNLLLDHYPVSPVPVADPLTLVCEPLTGAPVDGDLPALISRAGIDLNPLDLSRPDDALWLRACLWPENQERLRRLTAIEEHRGEWESVTLLRGGVLERLDDALQLGDARFPTVVWHTWAAAYFPADVQRRFAERMRDLVREGDVYWIYVEWPHLVRGLDPPTASNPSPTSSNCQIVVAEAGDEPRHWGWSHHHGRWISLSPTGPNA